MQQRLIKNVRDCLSLVMEISQWIATLSNVHFFLTTSRMKLALTLNDSNHCAQLVAWTVRTAAIESVVENYEPLTQAMEEINRTSHDEYVAKVGRILAQLHTFDTYFGFKLSHLVFSATEQLSRFLQTKNVSLREALRQAAAAVRFFERNRSDEAFCYFYKQVVEDFTEPPTLPRIRRTV